MTLPRLHHVLAGCCGALALALLYEVFAPLPAYSVPEIAATKATPLPTPPPSFVAPPPEAFAAIGDRPLFDVSRRKFVPPPTAAAQAAAPPPPPNLALVGIILDSQTKLAIVRTPDAALSTSLSVGASIGGWQLSTIEPDRIVLKAGTAEDEIRLDANKAAPPSGQRLAPAGQPVAGQQGQQQQQNTP